MNTQNAQLDLLMDIEARHNELMLKLDELDRKVEQTLVQWQGNRLGSGGGVAAGLKPHRDL